MYKSKIKLVLYHETQSMGTYFLEYENCEVKFLTNHMLIEKMGDDGITGQFFDINKIKQYKIWV